MARFLIRLLDAWLCRIYGVFEFYDAPDCILRLQVVRVKRTIRLPDLELQTGKPVLLLHLWNEKMQRFPSTGPDLAWAKVMERAFIESLKKAARYLSQDPRLVEVQAIGGVTILFPSQPGDGSLMKRLGFTLLPYSSPLGRFGEFWENFYSWLLIWTYNPASLPSHRLMRLRRTEFWISKEEFLRRFG
jgi:hypothetical protein